MRSTWLRKRSCVARKVQGSHFPSRQVFWMPERMTLPRDDLLLGMLCGPANSEKHQAGVCSRQQAAVTESLCVPAFRGEQLTQMLSSKACAMGEKVPVALAMSSATGPLPTVIHPQPPCCHQHPVPGGCRLDFRGDGQSLGNAQRWDGGV